MAGENTSTTTPSSVDAEYGIATTLSGYTIESANVTEEPQREVVHDQKNRVAKELRYDIKYSLRLTVRGATKPNPSNSLSYDGQTWIVDSVEDAGVYNGLRRFTIAAHRHTNCNADQAVS